MREGNLFCADLLWRIFDVEYTSVRKSVRLPHRHTRRHIDPGYHPSHSHYIQQQRQQQSLYVLQQQTNKHLLSKQQQQQQQKNSKK